MLNRLFASFSCFQYSFFSLQKNDGRNRGCCFLCRLPDFHSPPGKSPASSGLFTICFPMIYSLFSDHSLIIQKPALFYTCKAER